MVHIRLSLLKELIDLYSSSSIIKVAIALVRLSPRRQRGNMRLILKFALRKCTVRI
jgi:hypothetical protein